MLSDLKVHKDEKGFYLSAEYIFEDGYSTKKLIVPKIRLDDLYSSYCFHSCSDGTYLDTANCRYRLEPVNKQYYTIITIEEKPQEMTLSEIEKKLGHKVRIVSE